MPSFKDFNKQKLNQKTQKAISKKNKGYTSSFFYFLNFISINIFIFIFYFWYQVNQNRYSFTNDQDINSKPLLGNLTDFIKNENPLFKKDSIFQKILDPLKKNIPRWQYIIIHHSGIDVGNRESYNHYHIKEYNQSLLYHFIIGNGSASKDGEIEIGMRWENQVEGGHININKDLSKDIYNQKGIGICLVGNFESKSPSKLQFNQLIKLTLFLMKQFSISIENVLTHNDINKTKCPGFFFPKKAYYKELSNKIE